MIRLIASTIIDRPMLTHSNKKTDMKKFVERHIEELPYTIQAFRNSIVSVSREYKWCKLALMRKRIPLEIFTLIQPYLIMKHEKEYYPNVTHNQMVVPRKYLLLESKLYRMDIANDQTLKQIRQYLYETCEFREETKRNAWHLRQFIALDKKLNFIRHVLHLRYHSIGKGINYTKYDVEYLLRYWF